MRTTGFFGPFSLGSPEPWLTMTGAFLVVRPLSQTLGGLEHFRTGGSPMALWIRNLLIFFWGGDCQAVNMFDYHSGYDLFIGELKKWSFFCETWILGHSWVGYGKRCFFLESPVPETLKSDMILSWQLFLQISPNVNYYLVDHYFWSWSLLSLLHIVASSWSWLPVEFQRARETYRKRTCFYAWFKEMVFCLVFWWSICWGAKGFHKCGHLATQHPFENRFSH